MGYLLGLSILGNLAIVYLALRYIQEVNRASQTERRNLYDRIQAPEVAVVEAQREEFSEVPLHIDSLDDRAVEDFQNG